MEIIALSAKPIDYDGSRGISMTRAALVSRCADAFAVDVARVIAGGKLGRHPASMWQLFAVLEGEGWVSSGDGEPTRLCPGAAALWAPGEEHESGSADGMLVLLVQSKQRPLP